MTTTLLVSVFGFVIIWLTMAGTTQHPVIGILGGVLFGGGIVAGLFAQRPPEHQIRFRRH